MLTKEKLREVLQRLLEKSCKDQVKWQPIPVATFRMEDIGAPTARSIANGNAGRETGDWNYEVQFEDGSRIVVKSESPEVAPDWASADLIVNNRRVLGLKAEDGDQTGDFELLNNLVLEAGRHVEGWDKAVQQIEQQLDSDEPVGVVATAAR